MKRTTAAEWLDSLSADDPGAIAGRRDLRRLNALMGNVRWLRRRLTASVRGDDVVVEIGAGDGTLGVQTCARRPDLAARYHALDLAPRPQRWIANASWYQVDVNSDSAAPLLRQATVAAANLVLHHFDDQSLRRLGHLLSDCRLILACEPCRRQRHLWQGRLLFPLLHRITRHDMIVSIKAGFRGGELAAALGLDSGWHCEVHETPLGAYRLVAMNPAKSSPTTG